MTPLVDRLRRTSRRRHRRLRRWVRRHGGRRIAVLTALSIVVLGGLVFTYQALTATTSLRQAAVQAEVLQNQLVSGDAGARVTLDALRSSTASARSETDGILWSIGAKVPFLGKNVAAVRTVSAVLDQVARDALPPVVDVADQIDVNTFSPHDGKVDLTAVTAIAPSVAATHAALTSALDELDRLDTADLLTPLRGPVTAIHDRIQVAQSAASASDVAARLMPSMLGQADTRRYLLLIQNNAEVRATGGIPGSYAIITAKNGRLSMGKQGSIFDLPQFPQAVSPLAEDEKTVFTSQMVKDLRDITVTPDFPRTGEIGRAMARAGLDVDVDGVISVDPVAMSYILGGTGAVTVDGGVSLDQGNAVELLLNRVYLALKDSNAQDDFFESAARQIFDAVKSGATPARPVIAGLVRAVEENRLMVWSSHADEQAVLADTGLAGSFPDDSGPTPHVGVYFGDAVGGKMQYYFDFTTTAAATRCLAGGRQEITLRAELSSTAPQGLPPQVAGIDPTVPVGEMRFITWLYAPFGGRFADIRVNGEKQLITTAGLAGRAETSVPVTLKPGQRSVLTARIITGPGQDGAGVLSTTPGIHTLRNDTAITSACG